MKLIDADIMVTIEVYDDEHEEYNPERITIADALDHWTEEGCPPEVIAQEPRVLTLEEVCGSLKQPIWKEVRSSHKDLYTGWVLAYDIQTGQGITGTRLGMAEPSGRIVWYRLEDYGTKWRCWTSRPTEEQRRDTPWE